LNKTRKEKRRARNNAWRRKMRVVLLPRPQERFPEVRAFSWSRNGDSSSRDRSIDILLDAVSIASRKAIIK
jgi:hypothetical protein